MALNSAFTRWTSCADGRYPERGPHADQALGRGDGDRLLELSVGDQFQSVAFAPDGRYFLAVSSSDSVPGLNKPGVSIFKLELGHGIRTLYGLQGIVEKTIFSADGQLIAGRAVGEDRPSRMSSD